MEWSDRGVVLAARRHGEAAAYVELFTGEHGRHAGLVLGGWSRRQRGVLQPGNEVAARWRARLAEHLGTLTVELVRARASAHLDDPLRLAGLAAACATARAALPEREPHTPLYDGFLALLDAIEAADVWPAIYVRWEVELLKELGFGLDLRRCAVTGTADDLAYVSPRTGRAVSRAAAEPYRQRLLKLPSFLLASQAGAAEPDAVADGLALTGHFLERHVFAPQASRTPAARVRLVERFAREATISGDI